VTQHYTRSLVALAEALEEPRTARELAALLGLPSSSVYRRLESLTVIGRAEVVDRVRRGRVGKTAVRWRRI
jgi:DNA-binding IclR family transcriptional regulator